MGASKYFVLPYQVWLVWNLWMPRLLNPKPLAQGEVIVSHLWRQVEERRPVAWHMLILVRWVTVANSRVKG